MDQIGSALVAIVLGVGGLLVYFFGTNISLDKLVPDYPDEEGKIISRENSREQIRPWLFIAPAVFLLGVFLVYPALRTTYLSFFDDRSNNFVGLDNYVWAFKDDGFVLSLQNNVAWLAIVPLVSTVFGLLIAVLSDRVRWESAAKSFIFMPMAISFVGASIIWKFVYAFRATEQDQIGILNAVVVGLGGEAQTWYTEPPLNNLMLMIILIWIQTGFAMVLLSAALKNIPGEILEAARIDGANEIQVFFQVMIPQIMGTITVVMTTIIMVVLKVFDIVYTMTDGQFKTEVLGNYMYRWMFRNFDYGRGSMIAVTIMLAITPILYWNIREFLREESVR
ncbi:MAG: sugar ABC transporter permease [Anaerolineae bacterium]|nr:sugar ABC transporter permease [Anaerolineae bacterium]